jgi:hypothetical protein
VKQNSRLEARLELNLDGRSDKQKMNLLTKARRLTNPLDKTRKLDLEQLQQIPDKNLKPENSEGYLVLGQKQCPEQIFDDRLARKCFPGTQSRPIRSLYTGSEAELGTNPPFPPHCVASSATQIRRHSPPLLGNSCPSPSDLQIVASELLHRMTWGSGGISAGALDLWDGKADASPSR